VATLFLPDASAPASGVVVLGGSEGGLLLAEEVAALLASHGFAVLAVAYFALESLPPQLVEIPVEYLENATRWLLRRPEVAGSGVGVVGTSRGGELALVLASVCRRVRAVVGFAASSVVWPGVTPGALHPRSAWTRRGKGLPFAIPQPQPLSPKMAGPLILKGWFLAALENQVGIAKAMIPVERIRGAVLLISGGDDRMWPSRLLAELAMRRLATASGDHCFRHLHLTYPRAGHGVGRVPGLPAASTIVVNQDGTAYALGGSRRGNARSAQHAWRRVLAFLSSCLGRSAAADGARRPYA